MNEVILSFKNFDYCKSAREQLNYTSTNYICTGAKDRGCAEGDGGAPLMVKQKIMQGNQLKSRWFSVGVVSVGGYHYFNDQDSSKWSINVFTRVTYYCEWIKKVTNGDAICIDIHNPKNGANISQNGTMIKRRKLFTVHKKPGKGGYLESLGRKFKSINSFKPGGSSIIKNEQDKRKECVDQEKREGFCKSYKDHGICHNPKHKQYVRVRTICARTCDAC